MNQAGPAGSFCVCAVLCPRRKARYSIRVIRHALVSAAFVFSIFACVGDEAVQGFTKPPTEDEYLASCGTPKCPRTDADCKTAFRCQIDLLSAYKLRDVMQCLKETEAVEGCIDCNDRVVEVKYPKDGGEMMNACRTALDVGNCKGFKCSAGLRLYADDLQGSLKSCYEKGCTKEDPYAVAKCINIAAFAKAPNCSTACCTGGKFYACKNIDASQACFKDGNTADCQEITDPAFTAVCN